MNKLASKISCIPLVFLSYNNEELLTKDKIISIFNKFYKEVDVVSINYHKFKSNKKTKGDKVQEY